eukprot:gene6583-9049_t
MSTGRLNSIINKNLVTGKGFINGKFTVGSSTETFPVYNPANGQEICSLPKMKAVDASNAIQASDVAWKRWKSTSYVERSKFLRNMADLMRENIDDLATLITLEAGKPFSDSKGEILYAISFYDYYAEEARRIKGEIIESPNKNRRLFALRQSVGPAALITPWNFPSAMITRKVGPALAAGCTVVIKPSEDTPLSALALCSIAEQAGIPPGVINCLTVARDDVIDVGSTLCNSNLIRKVSFTGSTAVGKWLMRESASTVKRISLELGGNAPFIIFDDADLEIALNSLMIAKFRNAGQACISSNRILVQRGVYDKFSAMLAEKVNKNLICGDGFDKSTTLGPLINSQGLAKVKSHVDDCVAKGAKILTGGSVNHELNAQGGLFFNPTVMTNVNKTMLPYYQETFGPIVPLIPFDTEEEAVNMANDTQFGLASYACTKDMARAWRLTESLEAGMIGINEAAISLDSTPFGGVKESGIGREGGHYGLDEYLEVKYVCMGGLK